MPLVSITGPVSWMVWPGSASATLGHSWMEAGKFRVASLRMEILALALTGSSPKLGGGLAITATAPE